MDIKMNFNKILIQDVVNKREYNDIYKTMDVSDDSYSSNEYNGHANCNKVTNPINVQRKCSKQLLKNVIPFGDDNNFIYVDSQIFDKVDPNYGSDIGTPSTDKLVSAMDLLRLTIERNVILNQNYGVQNKANNNIHGQRNHRRRNNPTYSAETQSKKDNDLNDDDRMLKRKDKVIVEIRVVFLKVGEIDTLKEIYHADAFIQAKWREPKLDYKTVDELKTVNLDRCWNPLLFIDNILNESKDQYWLTTLQNDKSETFIIERRKIKGVFSETLELNDFPLDVQDLTITISSERPDSEIDMVPDNVELSCINVQTLVDQQEWRLHEHVEVTKRILTQEFSSSSRSHPCLSVTCRASRRPGYFYWNVFLVMFFITGLSFATFAVSPTRPENRLQLSFTLFLTSVAFKFVINQSLPRISYLTYMDKYVLMSLGILCIFSIWHSIVTLIDPPLPTNSTLIPNMNISKNSKSSGEILKYISNNILIQILLKTKNSSFLKRTLETNYSETANLEYDSFEKDIDFLRNLLDLTYIPSSKFENRKASSESNRKKYLAEMLLRYTFQKKVERDIFISFVFLYFLAHLLFTFWLYFDASKRRREMKEKDKQYKEWMKRNKEWTDTLNQHHRNSNVLVNRV